MEPAARYPRSLRRVVAAATTLAVSTAVVAVPEVPGVGLQRAEAQQAIQLPPELRNAEVSNNGSTWEATVFFEKPMEVRSVTFDFVPPSSTGANNSRNDSAADDDPILNKIPLEDTYNVVHWQRNRSGSTQVGQYPVVGFKSLGKSRSGRNTIRLTYELPAGTRVDQGDRLVLQAPGKAGVYPTPYLGASRFTNAWVNGGAVAGSVDGLPEGASVTVSAFNASGSELFKQDGVRGAYQIPDVQPGNYTMRVSGWEGYSFSPVNGVPVSVEMNAQETANFTFSRDGGVVAGSVDGLPEGATVTVSVVNAAGDVVDKRDGVRGVYEIDGLDPGDYTVRVSGWKGYSSSPVEGVPVSVKKNVRETANFNFSRDAGVVAGFVDGLPEGASVTVRVVDASGREVGKQDGVRGTYRIPGVPTGDHTVRVSGWKGYSSSPVEGVPVSVKKDAQETANFNFSRDERAVSGVVTKLPTGKTVTVHLEGVDAQTRGVRKSAQGVNGSFSIPDVPTGAYKVVVDEVEGYSFTVPPRVTVGAQGNTPSPVTVEAKRLTGGLNVYVPGNVPVDVSVIGPDDFKADFAGVTESFGWRAVGTGEYSVTLTGPEGYTVTERSGRDSVEVKTGETASVSFDAVRDERAVSGVVTQLPTDKTVTVRLVGADAQTRGTEYKAEGVNGAFTIPNVPTGAYSVELVGAPGGFTFYGSGSVKVGAERNDPASLDIEARRDTGVLNVGLPDVPVTVRVQGPEGYSETFTGKSGSLPLTELKTGFYTVTVTDPKGYSVKLAQGSSNPVEVKKDQTASVQFAADRVKRSVSGRVNNLPAGKTVTLRLVGADAQTRGTEYKAEGVNGAFTIPNVPTGTYDVKADDLAGYSFAAPSQVTVGAQGNTPSTVTVEAKRLTYTFSGTVENLPAGTTTRVRLVADDGTVTHAQIVDGAFTFKNVPTGDYRIELVDAPKGYSVSGPSTVEVKENGIDPADLKFTLGENPVTVTGSFTGEGDKPLPGTKVEFKQGDEVVRELVSDAQGKIRDEAFPPGDYTVVVTPPTGYEAPEPVEVTVNPGEEFTLDPVRVMRSTGNVVGEVVGAPDGAKLRARLTLEGETPREATVTGGEFKFDRIPTGSYKFELLGVPAGYSVSGVKPVVVEKDATARPKVTVSADAVTVTGSFTGEGDKPLPETKVEFKQGDEVVRELVSDEQGVVRDEAFPPGDYTVVVTPPTGYEAPEPVEVTVNLGEEFTLDPVRVVRSTGNVVGEVVGAPVGVALTARLTLEGETPREATVTGGEFKFDRIPTGSYKFELLGVPTGYSVSGVKPVVVEKDATAKPKVTVSADAVTVTGSFTGEDKKPLPGTKVEFKQGDEVVRELEADEQGVVRDEAFPPGEYTVVVTPPTGYEAPKPVEVTVKPGKDLELGTVEIASSEADDSFSWDNLRVAPGEVKVVTPDRSAKATAEVTFQTEKITQPDGTEVTVAPGQSWLEIESDGTVVARPPADTAPGTYQLEVVASTGERDTVTVEVSPAPSMKDRYKVDSQAVEVPAGSERRSSKPRASVREGAFTHANQPLPNGTTFDVNHKGASVDALGRVTFTPDANAKPGPVRIPVSVTFPDGSPASFDVVFNVGEPLLATQYPLTYPATANAPHKRTTAVQAMGQVPEGTRFALADDVELGDWFVSVDSVTGRLRAIPPSENAAPAEVKVVAYFTDGSTSELTTTLVAQKADFNVGGKTGLTYGSTVTQIGEQTTLKPQGPVKPGTRFAIDETFAKNGWDPRIDPVTGAITVRTDDTVPAGEQVLLPVVVALPDGSLETVEVPLRAVDKQKPSDGRTRAETTEGSSTSDWVVVLIGALVAIGGLTVALAMNEREVRRVLEKYGITW
ncbi:SpaA isopeptide-forming pilin-related protein [Corynebacterium sp. Marseille-P4321]|uniref:SpaA isopeptide-forming pilin-related protein n=1 Tax=Corynebacterium sp. Marseille-P4321 TaxID=2736603 RepID=UPI00158BC717|nr:SpaA isopeptide-forming pilin-related protein [Corynebacterium sp. Marseille-P4321]